jgi:hypothetical protein
VTRGCVRATAARDVALAAVAGLRVELAGERAAAARAAAEFAERMQAMSVAQQQTPRPAAAVAVLVDAACGGGGGDADGGARDGGVVGSAPHADAECETDAPVAVPTAPVACQATVDAEEGECQTTVSGADAADAARRLAVALWCARVAALWLGACIQKVRNRCGLLLATTCLSLPPCVCARAQCTTQRSAEHVAAVSTLRLSHAAMRRRCTAVVLASMWARVRTGLVRQTLRRRLQVWVVVVWRAAGVQPACIIMMGGVLVRAQMDYRLIAAAIRAREHQLDAAADELEADRSRHRARYERRMEGAVCAVA